MKDHMSTISTFNTKHTPQKRFGDLRVGWTVRIYQKVQEGQRAKNQIFEGIIIAKKHGNEPGATITVRKVSGGIGIEKILPLNLPAIEKIEVVKKARVRRAKLYYLREKSAKEIRKKTRQKLSNTKPPEIPKIQSQGV